MFKLVFLLLMTAFSAMAFAHGMSAADQERILNAGYLEYLRLGATHMLSGYDHLLFLFGVIFFLTRFNDILKFITVFTIGHSITLVFATLFGRKQVFESLKFQNTYAADARFYERISENFRVKKLDLRTYIYYRNNPDSACSKLKKMDFNRNISFQ